MTTNDKSYNGWTNYETWMINLHLRNEYSSYQYCLELTNTESVFRTADALKEHVEESLEDDSMNPLAYDLMQAALAEVNWDEIAQHLVDELQEIEQNS